MSERKINLEELLLKHIRFMLESNGKSKEQSKYLSNRIIKDEDFAYIKNAMKEACEQILELAASNAKKNEMVWDSKNGKWTNESDEINKQSILDTINQVEIN